MTKILAEGEFATALAAAAVADMERAPALKEAVASGAVSARALREMMLRDVESEAAGYPGVQIFPNIRRLIRDRAELQERLRAAGMEAAEVPATTSYDWLAPAVGAFTSIAGAIVNYQTQKKLAEAAKETAVATARSQELAAKQAELDAAATRLAYSKEAKAQSGLIPEIIPGVPGWAIPVGIAAVVGGVLLLRG